KSPHGGTVTPWTRRVHSMAQRTAKSKRSGQRCKRHARPGRSVCVMHGGKAPAAGPTHPTFKHGRYSKALGGTTIQEQYEKARTDPHLLPRTEDIAPHGAKPQDTTRPPP